jgi:3-oxoacyl-[acyl-carrier-protein] synthase-1
MTLAARRAAEFVGAKAQRIGWVMTDVVDERHRVDEWAFASARVAPAFTPGYVHDQPLLTTGDLGAASVGVMLAIAATLWQTECAPDDVVLIAAHSDRADRGALVLRAP